ncbi:MAG: hemerythrin domain-containing protein [Muribaculum sp.]|nr:hemerythrin domain-containing protein [Muribaculum sp.]
MKPTRNFTGKESVVDLIEQDYNILPVLSRFNIPLGFQDKRIDEVCAENGIDTGVFLFIINFILSGRIDVEALPKISPLAIVDFLHNSHDYFLRYKFPHIRQNLMQALDDSLGDINPAIIVFFDDYIKEVKKHFAYEETKVFPYIRSLIAGEISSYNINIFKRHHDEIAEKLNELKNIILRFYTTSMPNRMYDVLVDLYNAEEDLDSHADIENLILIPLIASLENKR